MARDTQGKAVTRMLAGHTQQTMAHAEVGGGWVSSWRMCLLVLASRTRLCAPTYKSSRVELSQVKAPHITATLPHAPLHTHHPEREGRGAAACGPEHKGLARILQCTHPPVHASSNAHACARVLQYVGCTHGGPHQGQAMALYPWPVVARLHARIAAVWLGAVACAVPLARRLGLRLD